jgi:nucleotide-binding universal stress UspA family protein
MAHKILCAVDGTKHSDRAVELATEMATKLGSELTIGSVNVLVSGGRGPMIYAKDDEVVEGVVQAATTAAEKAGAKNVKQVVLRSREAASGIVAYAEEGHYDIIVTGTGDKHGLSRLMLGSVAADVAGRAHCTVIVAR